MKKVKHSKYKNSGILFELLTRQVTVDTIENVKENISLDIIKKYFNKKTELYKEYKLYEVLLKTKMQKESRAKNLLNNVLSTRKKLNSAKLTQEKYDLIHQIKSKYDIKDFLNTPINNYKVFGSIYSLFEHSILNEISDVEQVQSCEDVILDFIMKKNEEVSHSSNIEEAYKNEEEDIRLLAYKLLIEKFNEKYQGLSSKQKRLLKEYINNLSNTNNLRNYINGEADNIKILIESYITKVDSDITKIKLKESINLLQTIKSGNIVKENQLRSLFYYYEIIDEMEKLHG